MYGKYLLVAIFVAVFTAAYGGEGHEEISNKIKKCFEDNHLTEDEMMKKKDEKAVMCGDPNTEGATKCILELFGEFDGTDLHKDLISEHFRAVSYEEDIPKLEICIDEAQNKEPSKKPCGLMDCINREGIRHMKDKKD